MDMDTPRAAPPRPVLTPGVRPLLRGDPPGAVCRVSTGAHGQKRSPLMAAPAIECSRPEAAGHSNGTCSILCHLGSLVALGALGADPNSSDGGSGVALATATRRVDNSVAILKKMICTQVQLQR